MRSAVVAPPRWAYAWWGVVGALLGVGVAALLSIGFALLLAAALLSVVGALVPALRSRAVAAVPAGVACAALYLAWLNRDGPGTVCETTGLETRCSEEWSPWPFLVVAVLLVAASIVLERRSRRTGQTSERPS